MTDCKIQRFTRYLNDMHYRFYDLSIMIDFKSSPDIWREIAFSLLIQMLAFSVFLLEIMKCIKCRENNIIKPPEILLSCYS